MQLLHHTPKKTALIIGGGGFKTLVAFGALRIIEKERIPFDSMYCVSGGNFPGGLFVSNGCTVGPGEALWQEMVKNPVDVFEYRNLFRIATSPLKIPSLCKIGPLLVLIKMIDIPALVTQQKRFVTSAIRVPTQREIQNGAYPETVFFSSDDPEIKKDPDIMGWAIAASCGIAGMFDSVAVRYQGRYDQYIDGAYQDALPLKKVIEDGHDTIIVVRAQSRRVVRPYPRSWLDRISYTDNLRNNEIEEDKIAIAHFLHPHINWFIVEPEWLPEDLTATTFRRENCVQAITHGEAVARNVLDPLIEFYDRERKKNSEK